MRSIHDIVHAVNLAILDTIPTAKVYGISTATSKGPSVDDGSVAFTDKYGVIIYHKLNSITNAFVPGSGYGDSQGDMGNTFGLSMIVYHNQKLAKYRTDQLVMILQANTPRRVRSEMFKKVGITYTNVDLSGPAIWAREYSKPAAEYPLPSSQGLVQINYSVLAVYKEGCYADCIEDFLCNT